MKISVRFHGLQSSDALRHHTMRRIHAQLSRFGQELSTVMVRIGDVNGPKGGIDKRCQVTVRGPRFGSSSLDERSSNAYAAVDSAIKRVAQTVGRRIERARGWKVESPVVPKA